MGQTSEFITKTMLATCALCVISFQVHAEDRLSDARIKDFYAESAEVQKLSDNTTIEFMKQHVHNDAKISMTTNTTLPGMPAQTQKNAFSKAELVDQAQKGQDMSQVVSLENEVLSTDISADGRSAAVRDRSNSVFTIDVPGPEGKAIKMQSTQATTCNTDLKLSSRNLIQIYKTDCVVDASIAPAH